MAVTIDSQPAAVVPAGNCVEFKLISDDAGTPPQVISIGYQLWIGGSAAMSIEQIPHTGLSEPLDFSRLLKANLATSVQQPGVQVEGVQDTQAAVQFFLKYGTITFDSSDCSTVQDVTNNSLTLKAVNSAYQVFEDSSEMVGSSLMAVLTSRPSRMEMRRDQNDWLWVYRAAGQQVTIVFRPFTADGTELTGYDFTYVSTDVHITSIGPANHPGAAGMLDAADYYLVEVRAGATAISPLYASYTFILKNGCIGQSVQADQLYFLEPKGGYAGLSFDNVRIGGGVSSFRYDEGRPCSASGGGRFRGDIEAVKRITWQTTLAYQFGIDQFLDGLFSTKYVYTRWRLTDASYTLVRVNILDGDYQVADNNREVQLTVNGEVYLPINHL